MPPHSKILLITGTDTGVGKTTVAVLLAACLREMKIDLRVMKPIETGCTVLSSAELEAQDAQLLWKASGQKQTMNEIVPWKFLPPLAPQMAAQEAGVQIPTEELVQKIKTQAALCDILLIEGAGGLLVPIANAYSFANLAKDLAKDCEMSVLVVVGSRLGAINHAALTFETLCHRKLSVLGYVLNDLFSQSTNHGEKNYALQKAALKTNRELLQSVAANYAIKEICFLPCLHIPNDLNWPPEKAVEVAVRKLGGEITQWIVKPLV